jgi:hypothetical protein
MSNIVRTRIKISELEHGMTVEFNGEILTVSRKDIKKNEHGLSYRGDSRQKEITRIQYLVPTAFGTVLRG